MSPLSPENSANPPNPLSPADSAAEFRASLECYRGPLDLLLYLIKRDEVDILDIPLGRITEQYLGYIQVLSSVDPNACGEFLVVAARLMEIKSRELLPVDMPEDEEEELEDPRLELVLQLLEYKKYKERAILLEDMVGEHRRRHRRPETDLDDLPEEPTMPLELGDVSMWDLVTAFQKVQLALSMRQPHHILFEDRPLKDYIDAIHSRLSALDDDEGLSFESFFDECRDRYDAIGYFLAILELAKQGSILFAQETLFGSISIRWNPDSGARSAVASVSDTDTESDSVSDSDPETVSDPVSDPVSESDSDSDPDPDSPSPGTNRISGLLSDASPFSEKPFSEKPRSEESFPPRDS